MNNLNDYKWREHQGLWHGNTPNLHNWLFCIKFDDGIEYDFAIHKGNHWAWKEKPAPYWKFYKTYRNVL